VEINQNGSGNLGHSTAKQGIFSVETPSSRNNGQDPNNLPVPNRPIIISSRHPLQISRSYYDMLKFNTVQEHDVDDNDEESYLPHGEDSSLHL
jgi:hypothetical protein